MGPLKKEKREFFIKKNTLPDGLPIIKDIPTSPTSRLRNIFTAAIFAGVAIMGANCSIDGRSFPGINTGGTGVGGEEGGETGGAGGIENNGGGGAVDFGGAGGSMNNGTGGNTPEDCLPEAVAGTLQQKVQVIGVYSFYDKNGDPIQNYSGIGLNNSPDNVANLPASFTGVTGSLTENPTMLLGDGTLGDFTCYAIPVDPAQCNVEDLSCLDKIALGNFCSVQVESPTCTIGPSDSWVLVAKRNGQ